MTNQGPEYVGPYDAAFGRCAYGHKVNSWGRCEPLNTTGCPRDGETIWDPQTEPDGRD